MTLVNGTRPEQFVTTLRSGDYFGEQALVRNGKTREATVVAGDETSEASNATPNLVPQGPQLASDNSINSSNFCCLYLERRDFETLGVREKLPFVKRKAVVVSSEEYRENNLKHMEKTISKEERKGKTVEERQHIIKSLKVNSTLKHLVRMTDDMAVQLADCAYYQSCQENEEILKYGDIEADTFYIIKSGEFTFCLPEAADNYGQLRAGENGQLISGNYSHLEKSNFSRCLGSARRGGSFGELALLYHAPRAATVACTSRGGGELWVIDRWQFKSILHSFNASSNQLLDQKMEKIVNLLEDIDLFRVLLADERATLAEALVMVNYKKDDVIMSEGVSGKAFYILTDGQVEISSEKDGVVVENKTLLSAGNYGPQTGASGGINGANGASGQGYQW
jgi:CRP-like cAMP-binding protein